MAIVLKVSYFLGAMCIGFGIGLVHLDDGKRLSIGVGLITMGLCLIGIGAGVI